MANFITPILGKLEKSEYHTRNSYEFQSHIIQKVFDRNEVMISFDVISLFTNASIPDIKQIIIDRWPEISKYETMTRKIWS